MTTAPTTPPVPESAPVPSASELLQGVADRRRLRHRGSGGRSGHYAS